MEWVKIKFIDGYEVSDEGEVRSIDRVIETKTGKRIMNGKILKKVNNKGYYTVHLTNNNKAKIYRVSRLVAEAFIPNPDNLPYVDHIDGDKHNNSKTNLRWVDAKMNKNNPNTIANGMRKKGEFHHSEETKKLIGEKTKGKTPWMKGRKHTEEAKEKNRLAHIGRQNHMKPVIQYTKDGEFVKEWKSITDVLNHYNINNKSGNISQCCNGKAKTAYGYIWKYKE